MTGKQSGTPISEDDVRAFAAKAHAWAETLSPQGRTILGEVFRRAVGEPTDDVAGHSMVHQPLVPMTWTPNALSTWAETAAFKACATGKHIPSVTL